MIAMLEGRLLPLFLVAKIREKCLYGKTRFQKIFFIFQKESETSQILDPVYEFQMYHHGPYSKELAREIESLVRQGLLKERIETTSLGYDVFTYHLTEYGNQTIQEAIKKNLISKAVLQILQKVLDEFSQLNLEALVEKAYEYGI